MWIAFRLPKPIVYWASIRLVAHASQGEYGTEEVPALRAMDAIRRWGYGQ